MHHVGEIADLQEAAVLIEKLERGIVVVAQIGFALLPSSVFCFNEQAASAPAVGMRRGELFEPALELIEEIFGRAPEAIDAAGRRQLAEELVNDPASAITVLQLLPFGSCGAIFDDFGKEGRPIAFVPIAFLQA